MFLDSLKSRPKAMRPCPIARFCAPIFLFVLYLSLSSAEPLDSPRAVSFSSAGAAEEPPLSGITKGSDSGAPTTHHNSDQPIRSFALQPGSGNATATVSGKVWLDNNGNGSFDNGEQGFEGFTVSLLTSPGGKTAATTTTDADGNYSITIDAAPAPGNNYAIRVSIPNFDYATIPGDSQINANGRSGVFVLYAGEPPMQINAGIRSMQVTTLQDDAAAAIPMQITLRDSIETGNNGPPTTAVTFQQGLSGTISLEAQLAPIKRSYNIIGPGADRITIDGDGKAGTILTIDEGVASTISDLTITGGSGTNGGGIFNPIGGRTPAARNAGALQDLPYRRTVESFSFAFNLTR